MEILKRWSWPRWSFSVLVAWVMFKFGFQLSSSSSGYYVGGGVPSWSPCSIWAWRLNGCTRTWEDRLEAAIFSFLLWTTASSAAVPPRAADLVFVRWARLSGFYSLGRLRRVNFSGSCRKPCVSRFEGVFFCGSSRQLVVHSVCASSSDFSLPWFNLGRYASVFSFILCLLLRALLIVSISIFFCS